VETRFANMPPCLIGMEACVGAHHLSRQLRALGHDARLMPAKYVRPYSKGQKNDFRDAEASSPLLRFFAPGLRLRPAHAQVSRRVGQGGRAGCAL
jgi:transposase